MKLATRITAGNLTLVAILLGLAGYFLHGLEELNVEETGRFLSLAQQVEELDAAMTDLAARLQRSALLEDEELGEKTEELGREVTARIEDLRQGVREASLALDAGTRLEAALQELFGAWRAFQGIAIVPELHSDLPAGEAVIDAWALQLADAGGRVKRALRTIVEEVEVAMQAPAKQLLRAKRRTTRTSLWAAAVALVLALAVALGVLGAATRPLERLARGARAIASGDLSFRVSPQGSPEVRGLARDFNAMAERLHELNRLKSDFVSSVSHDLKAPLASIAETTSLLLDGLPGPLTEKQSRLLALNLESSRRLGQMIENLLDLSRIETGALALQFLRHDLVVLAGQVVDQLRGLIDKKGLAVAIEGAAGTAMVECDAASIRRALGNLVANAVTFSPAGGRIDIRVQPRAKESVEVLVADQGPGVPDAEKERIFQRFYRSEHGARGPGTGIGLAIARAVLEAHGGVLWVRDGPSGGSVFSCLLPRSRRAPREALA